MDTWESESDSSFYKLDGNTSQSDDEKNVRGRII